MAERPRSRQKNVTGGGQGVHRRGSGLGGGPVGRGAGRSGPGGSFGGAGGMGGAQSGASGRRGGPSRGAMIGGGISLPVLLIMALMYFLGGGVDPESMLYQTDSSDWTTTAEAKLDTSVADGSREKYTKIAGNGSDVVTLMVYMCGTDLESRSGMATNDLKEMASAGIADNVNLLVYTGGCTQWRNSTVSSSTNQIYKVENGNLRTLKSDDGAKPMVSPETLSSFIKWSAAKYPADRYELILWDHGGGSVSGYGYDEKYKNAGSMTLSGINQALKDGNVKFDFVGFDACLMATAETALMLDDYSDYMIASEETEPGIGWYYTNWLSRLSGNTSMSTLEIGKNIIDDFTATCAKQCSGQKTTLSVIDLAEFSNTVPDKLNAFAKGVSTKLSSSEYREVSDARYHAREFAASSQIDQVDLVNLADNLGTSEGTALSQALQGAVKYNRTSSNMTNAYGVSIYFPYRRTSYVEKAADNYEEIGMDGDYADCIRAFARAEQAGQPSSGDLTSLYSLLLGGANRAVSGLPEDALDASRLVWQEDEDGTAKLSLSEEEWESVHSLDLNMFYDDGSGYVDLGWDNVFDFDDDGNLIADTDRTWVAINGQPVAYYHLDTTEDGDDYTITGRVPAKLNGDAVNLLLVFDSDNPDGYIAGAMYDYEDTGVETVAKNMTELSVGDKLDFTCDFYSYDGEFEDSYYLGDPMRVTDDMAVSNVDVGDGAVKLAYRFTDIYNQEYWTTVLDR